MKPKQPRKAYLENIKKAAIGEGLSRALSSTLWDIRKLTEDAAKENYKDFLKCKAKILTRLTDAEDVFTELKK